IALHENPDLRLPAHRLLNGRDRSGPAYRNGEDYAREQHEIPDRNDDQGIGRDVAYGRDPARGGAFGLRSTGKLAAPAHWPRSPFVQDLPRLMIRQPFLTVRLIVRYRPAGNGSLRSNRPCGNSIR